MLTKTEYLKDKEEQKYFAKLNKEAELWGSEQAWKSKDGRADNKRDSEKTREYHQKMREYIMAKQGEAIKKRNLRFKI